MTDPQTTPAPVRVSESDGHVLLTPDDNDLFIRTGKQVIEACRLDISVELWLKEFHSMLDAATAWIHQRSAKVQSCYCAPRGSRVILFFVPTTTHFDFDLADELAVLNDELVKQFNVGMVEIRQIPRDEVDRFLDPEKTRRIYGSAPGPLQTVDA